MPEVIDMTPTWTDILPTLLVIMRDSSPRGQREAETQLRNMARLADLAVKALKEGKIDA